MNFEEWREDVVMQARRDGQPLIAPLVSNSVSRFLKCAHLNTEPHLRAIETLSLLECLSRKKDGHGKQGQAPQSNR